MANGHISPRISHNILDRSSPTSHFRIDRNMLVRMINVAFVIA